MKNELITPIGTETVVLGDLGTKLVKVEFPEGFSTVELNVDHPKAGDPYQDFVVSGPEGALESPADTRYPFTRHVASLMAAHYCEYGDYPAPFQLKG